MKSPSLPFISQSLGFLPGKKKGVWVHTYVSMCIYWGYLCTKTEIKQTNHALPLHLLLFYEVSLSHTHHQSLGPASSALQMSKFWGRDGWTPW